MISAGRGRVLLIMLAAVVALAVGETLLAKGMKQARTEADWASLVVAIVRNGWILAGFALLLFHVGLYMQALKGADLSFALPLTAASYPLGALLAKFYLREDVSTARWLGTIVITAGVAIIAMSDSAATDH